MNFGFWIVFIAFLVATNCGLLGCFLILRRQAMLGDAISHAVLPGIVLTFLATKSMHPLALLIGAMIAGIVTTTLISFFHQQAHVAADVAIGITFTSSFALGILLISLYTSKADLDLNCVLNGQLVFQHLDVWKYQGISRGPKAVYILAILCLFNVVFILLAYPALVLTSFDATFAQIVGVNTTLWHYALMILTSITVVIAFKIVGSIMVVAFLVTPPASAYLLTNRLPVMIGYTLVIDALIAFLGYQLAVLLNASVPGAMVSIAGILFGLAFLHSQQNAQK